MHKCKFNWLYLYCLTISVSWSILIKIHNLRKKFPILSHTLLLQRNLALNVDESMRDANLFCRCRELTSSSRSCMDLILSFSSEAELRILLRCSFSCSSLVLLDWYKQKLMLVLYINTVRSFTYQSYKVINGQFVIWHC